MGKTAIMVDGGFYRKRANYLLGEKSAEDRADELVEYCSKHLWDNYTNSRRELYRIFYYDCSPSEKSIYNPITKKTIDLSKSTSYKWSNDFFKALCKKRKVALRKGELLDLSTGYTLRWEALKKLCDGSLTVDQLTESDLSLNVTQKGVDMRIGLDIASLCHKGLVDQIILIAGDSDFVPAAKYARREGIDFILDPMWHPIKDSLNEHIDGLSTKVLKPPRNTDDPLHTNHTSNQTRTKHS